MLSSQAVVLGWVQGVLLYLLGPVQTNELSLVSECGTESSRVDLPGLTSLMITWCVQGDNLNTEIDMLESVMENMSK